MQLIRFVNIIRACGIHSERDTTVWIHCCFKLLFSLRPQCDYIQQRVVVWGQEVKLKQTASSVWHVSILRQWISGHWVTGQEGGFPGVLGKSLTASHLMCYHGTICLYPVITVKCFWVQIVRTVDWKLLVTVKMQKALVYFGSHVTNWVIFLTVLTAAELNEYLCFWLCA